MQIGSPWMDDAINWAGFYDNLWRRDMISDEAHADMFKFCNFSNFVISTKSNECGRAVDKVAEENGNIQIFNIYAPFCNISAISNDIESVRIFNLTQNIL